MVRCARQPVGLLLALLALTAQLALSASVPQSALIPVGVICHAGDDATPAPTTPHHPTQDCVFCPLCTALGTSFLTLTDYPVFPAPRLVLIGQAVVLPPATAPPAATRLAAQPRGPPSLA